MNQVIIDVREPEEFAAGHVDGAFNIPLGAISEDPKIAAIDKNTPIMLYCRSGGRAATALDILKQRGFTKLTNAMNQAGVEKLLEA